MPAFSANLNFLYADRPLPDRIAAAAAAGFAGVEFTPPYDAGPEAVRDLLKRHSLEMVLMNAPAGTRAAGENGLAVLEGRDRDFADSVETALRFAQVLGCKRIHVMSGVNNPEEPRGKAAGRLSERLQFAADTFKPHGIDAMVEFINPYDMPGYFINSPTQALEIIARTGRDNVRLQFDVYHAQRMAGDLARSIRANLGVIGHIQIADNPGRHQPGTGEINFSFLLPELDRMGYCGWVGLEYVPEPSTDESLGWMQVFR